MKKNDTDVYLIHIIIKKHIETISESEKEKQDKDISYTVIQEIIKCIVEQYNKSISAIERHELKTIMKKINQELFNYLAKFNRYDHKILDSYVTLEKITND